MNSMKKFTLFLTMGVAVLGIALGLNWGITALADVDSPVGNLSPGFTYQGYLEERGMPANGIYNFSFEIFDAEVGGESWGVFEVTHVEVVNGIFTVLLEFDLEVFNGDDRWLEIGVDPEGGGEYLILEERQPITPTPYALFAVQAVQAKTAEDADTVDGFHGATLEESAEINADIAVHAAIPDAHHTRVTEAEVWTWTNLGHGGGFNADMVDGMHASDLEVHYQNVVIVAKSGGDFTSVQSAIDSITGASSSNPYLVWIAPGIFNETVTMKSHVHLQGSGQEVTAITSETSSGWLPTAGTLVLASDTSLRDLTVDNSGTGDRNVAILATAGMTRTLVADVTAQSNGSGTFNYGVFLAGSGTGALLERVTALGENGTTANYGLYNFYGPEILLRSGSYSGIGGTVTSGIYCAGAETSLDAENVSAIGKYGSDNNEGLSNNSGSIVSLRGGSYAGIGGFTTNGISNEDINTTLFAENVAVLAENSTNGNYGLYNWDGATATLRGGSFTGRGGSHSEGIRNGLEGTYLEAGYVTALGENGTSHNYGVYNYYMSTATLLEGSFSGRGGMFANGILNQNISTTLVTENVIALGENASDECIGFNNTNLAVATLKGGSYTGHGGMMAIGIQNEIFSTLAAENVIALGENGSNSTKGLYNLNGATAIAQSSTFTGRTDGSSWAYGIHNDGRNVIMPILEASNVNAWGESSGTGLGLSNHHALAKLQGGNYDGRGTINESVGIYNLGDASVLEADNVYVLGSDSNHINYGLYNGDCAKATLRGSSFVGSGGLAGYGIDNSSPDSCVEPASIIAENISAIGKNGSDYTAGLINDGTTTLKGSIVHGNGDVETTGILNSGTLEVQNCSLLGDGGSINYGLTNYDGTVHITHSTVEGTPNSILDQDDSFFVYLYHTRLIGGMSPGLICIAVSYGLTFPFTCP